MDFSRIVFLYNGYDFIPCLFVTKILLCFCELEGKIIHLSWVTMFAWWDSSCVLVGLCTRTIIWRLPKNLLRFHHFQLALYAAHVTAHYPEDKKVLFCLFENCIRTCDNWFNYYPHLWLLLKSATLCEMSSKWFPISLKEREETKNNSQGLIAKVWMPTKQAIFIVSESIFIIFVFSESITWALAWSPWSSHCHPFHPAPPFVPPNNKIFRLRWKIFQQDGISQPSEFFFMKTITMSQLS